MEKIESLQNARIKKWCRLHTKKGRDEMKRFLIEGEHLIEEALKANVVETIITDTTCPFAFEEVVLVSEAVMKKVSQNVSKVHLIAVCKEVEVDLTKKERLLILDGVQDPGNLGTMVRTAMAFQFDAVYLSNQCADLYNDKTIRSTQGALFHMPVIRVKDELDCLVASLQEEGVNVVATTLDDAKPLKEVETCSKMAFILGNEGQGVSKSLQAMANQRLRIEMQGFESLNVAVAAGIVMYTFQERVK